MEGGELVMDFSELFSTFPSAITIITTTPGHHDWQQGGVWVPGTEVETDATGIVVPLSFTDLKFGPGGSYTTADRKLYSQSPIEMGSTVEHDGIRYTVVQEQDFSEHADFYAYVIKRVST